MARKTKRVKEMMENFMVLRKEDRTIAEIAAMFGITPFTIYNYLQEIADANGVEREELLYIPHPNYSRVAEGQKQEIADFEEVKQLSNGISKQVDNLLSSISTII